MKKNLMSLVVAGSWVLWASAANAEITMKLTGCPPEVADWDYGDSWWVDTDSGPEDAIYDIAEDGTFTTDVPEGTLLSAKLFSDAYSIESVDQPAIDGNDLIACLGWKPHD